MSASSCVKSVTTFGLPCVVHRNPDYPYWQLGYNQTFPCACGRKRLDPRLLVLTEILAEEPEEDRPTARSPPPGVLSGWEVTELVNQGG